MPKIQNIKFSKTPILGSSMPPGCPQIKKLHYIKYFQNFYVKMPNCKKKRNFPLIPNHLDPYILDPTPKFKFLLPIISDHWSEVSKKVCHTPVLQDKNLGGDISRNRPFCPWAVHWMLADLRPPPKNYFYSFGLVMKISSRSFHIIKSYSTF